MEYVGNKVGLKKKCLVAKSRNMITRYIIYLLYEHALILICFVIQINDGRNIFTPPVIALLYAYFILLLLVRDMMNIGSTYFKALLFGFTYRLGNESEALSYKYIRGIDA